MTGMASPRILPGLDVIASAFWEDLVNGVLIRHGAISLMRAMIGYGLAALVGVALGTAMARSRIIDDLLEPIFFFGYPIPKIALFPIFTFVFGIGTMSKVAFIFLECLYPITVATFFAIRHVDKTLIWSARSMGAGRSRIFWRVLLPAAAPSIYAGLRIALPVSIIVVIITEMIGDTTGLGFYITWSATSFEYQKVYAGIAAVGVLGFTLDRLFAWSRRHLLYWERGREPGA
jgi:ABC-type nitrate/sulfonate/bicarbonate transport system permease component